jgi:hypothetical protein
MIKLVLSSNNKHFIFIKYKMSFDIVIPLGPNEYNRFSEVIKCIKNNVVDYRKIFIVTSNLDLKIDNCVIIDENIFPYKEYLKSHLEKGTISLRVGWYFQQLIKLNIGFYIEDILDNYLVIDADVLFLKPLHFMKNNLPIFTSSEEYHEPYFRHMQLLHTDLNKYHHYSGISHHMLFNKKYLLGLFNMIELKHGKPFWKVFIDCIDNSNPSNTSGASEFEIYFNYMVKKYPNQILIRSLNWENISISDFNSNSYNKELDYISICHYI